MSAAKFSSVESTLQSVAGHFRDKLNLPILLRWQDGEDIKLGQFDQAQVIINIRDARGAAALASPSIDRLSEAYVEGHLDVQGSMQDIVSLAYTLAANAQPQSTDAAPPLMHRVRRKLATAVRHTRQKDKADIQYHYDVSNDFYAEWLDPRMLYSCAYFETGEETLEQAQLKKLDHILTKLRLQPGQRLLDIGCGWGAMVLRAAQKFGARCVGITLSQNQYELARERVRDAGLQDQIDIRLQDYRDVEGEFDRITSVGMCEHVGLKNMEAYFRVIRDRLTPGGWVLNHNITSTDADNADSSYGGGDFIDKYVFPDGELPHISFTLSSMQRAGLEAIDVEGLRRHYAQTLRCWSDVFEAKADKLRTMVDEKTWRVWRIYLVGCQWAFENDEISVYQVLAHRAGQNCYSLPRSRGWMYA